jgi:hypothetical protein
VKHKTKFYNLLIVFLIGTLIFFSGCTRSGYQKFYNPILNQRTLYYSQSLEFLKPEQEPLIFQTDDMERDIMAFLSKRYVVLGYSDFNGPYEDIKNATAQAKNIGATLVLIQYSNTETRTVYIKDINQNIESSSDKGFQGAEIKSEKSVAINQRPYNQKAFYLVKDNENTKLGFRLTNLTPEMPEKIERNTGALVFVVFEDSPAAYANIINGDVLLAIDDFSVINAEQAMNHIKQIDDSVPSCLLTVLRNGEEKKIDVVLGSIHQNH